MIFNTRLRSKDKVAMFFRIQQRILILMYLNRTGGTSKLHYNPWVMQQGKQAIKYTLFELTATVNSWFCFKKLCPCQYIVIKDKNFMRLAHILQPFLFKEGSYTALS